LALTALTVGALLVASYMAFAYAPTELNMGAVQRVLYFHVASVYAGALAFAVTALCGGVYLLSARTWWDRAAASAAEVGLMMLTMTLLSGPVWAHYAWGKAWTWDPKLTSALTMWLAYAAYLMLRKGIADPQRRARFSGVYGLVAFASVIMTFFGISMTATSIQPVTMQNGGGLFGWGSRMGQAMVVSQAAFVLLFATFFWYRLRLAALAERIERLRMRAIYGGEALYD
jgi:heme exporter protein C